MGQGWEKQKSLCVSAAAFNVGFEPWYQHCGPVSRGQVRTGLALQSGWCLPSPGCFPLLFSQTAAGTLLVCRVENKMGLV